MTEPNHQLQRARLRIESPNASGEPLSRRELADLVNSWVLEHAGRTTAIDDHYIGKLERGMIRWPQADYRAAVRAILRVQTDHELGFRRRRVAASEGSIPSASLTAPGTVQPPDMTFGWPPERSLLSPTIDAAKPTGDLLLLDEWSAMYRRDLLTGAFSVGALVHLESYLSTMDADPVAKISVLRAVTMAQRRREGSIPARELAGIVVEHLRLLRSVGGALQDPAARRAVTEALSEGFGFLAWLCWDMQDIGSAQRYYQAAARLARESQHRTLTGYMLGSLAALCARTGHGHRSVLLMERAWDALPNRRHGIVDAWINSTAAVSYAAVGDRNAAWRHLGHAEEAVAGIPSDEQPPWPWVIQFDDTKLAGYRLNAAIHLGCPDLALKWAPAATAAPARKHTAQYALTLLDQAAAHCTKADYEQSADIALAALSIAAAKNSRRVIDSAWRTRQAIPNNATCDAVGQLDARLHELDPIDV
ncbi:hypothetical protein [Frankia sp. Cas3]|uniref:hypothetical protein n=1 Tax=Frankia sp. Cas3 TaxID=3073926 RepID=UPI002AD2EF46|nr:hypothetical protein [Frankia sp. Cas3]